MTRHGSLMVLVLALLTLTGCGGGGAEGLRISAITTSDTPIQEGEELPQFHVMFDEGVEVIHVYAWLEGIDTVKEDKFPVELVWFSPNDMVQPIAKTAIEVIPPQRIAQFEIRNPEGMRKSSHQVTITAGPDREDTKSARFYIGMTEEEVLATREFEKQQREALQK